MFSIQPSQSQYIFKAYVLLVFEEDSKVVVGTEDGVVGQPAQENFVHGHRFLERGQIFPAKKNESTIQFNA